MGRYVARRLLQMIPVFIGTTLLIFLMVYSLPGDPVRALWGDRPADPQAMARLRHEYWFDRPVLMQYLHYMNGLIHLDFGTSFVTGRQVIDVIKDAFPVTIRLALVAFVIEIVVGLGLGLFSGLNRGKLPDKLVLLITLLLISIPVFVLGFIFQTVFGNQLGWITPTVQDSSDITQLLLPGIVLGSLSFSYVARLSRTSLAENLRADYIRTAVAKGLPRRRVIGIHLLRNSLIPVVTFLGTDLGALMGGAIVTEGIFNVHGIGNELYRSINQSDNTTVVGIVTILVIIFLLSSLIVDLLYAALDPRIRYA
ncbi:ABC transporter permease [Streptomyces sp. NBC_01387]|uniref:ABC transporter permease n=1 Tax=unclassified Streptomyces TaxID=2593676 RepID=UPI002023FB76|nr:MULTISPECIES: ABC transporter permease [unclassified Streptomyces]MCX4548456.1 ABC transporter permease [Streptomyces sp. NBC_01500]WSC20076.1 ABC transporter permease [Streptomyces sp. NBC_01766]WSV54097.1 ABC transporter permease [Streptomyces sp. NBC_01014]